MFEKTFTIPLDEPVEWNATTYTEVTVREPTYLQQREALAKPRPEDQDLAFLQICTGLPAQVLLKLPASVANEAGSLIQDFLGRRRLKKPGESLSPMSPPSTDGPQT